MPDYNEVDKKREMADSLLESLRKMDLGEEVGKGLSIESAVGNVGLDAIAFIWQENLMKDRRARFQLMDHLDTYPKGLLATTLRYVVDSFVALGNVDKKKALNDFGLLEE